MIESTFPTVVIGFAVGWQLVGFIAELVVQVYERVRR